MTIDPIIAPNLQRRLLDALRSYAASRRHDVARGAETPALAALLVDKYGQGMAAAARLVELSDTELSNELQRLTLEIDPDFETHRQERWNARPAKLVFDSTR